MSSPVRDPHRPDLPLQLAAWRWYRRLTGPELAQRAGLDLRKVTELEAGTRRGRTATLQRLATALDTDPWSLYSLPPDPGGTVWHVVCALRGLDDALTAARTSGLTGASLARAIAARDDAQLTDLQELWTILGNGGLADLLEVWQHAGKLLVARGQAAARSPQPHG